MSGLKDVSNSPYRSLPFWSWNTKLEPEKLREQIRWMKEKGIGGFFMHARGGLETEYLSEEWMQCVDAAIDEAKKCGMDPWIYDENGWPSGFVGGKLLADLDNRDRYLEFKIGEYDPNSFVSYRCDGDALVRGESGEGTYLNIYECLSDCTVDILNPDVVRKFIDETHELYYERYGEEFAKKVKGFFTDEPQYYRWHTPYTTMVASYFKETYNEDILDKLGLLFVEKEGYREFRYRYWTAMQKLMLDNFAKQLYEWCDSHGTQLTGHYVEEVSIGWQILCCAGVMPFYEYEHIPGMDRLGKARAGLLAQLQLGSVAAQLGKKQVMTETFGCTGWDVTPQTLKSIVEQQFVCGVNLICQHLLPVSERGQRKYDYPLHFSDVNPWAESGFKSFNDYFTRLGELLGTSKKPANVAMLHPIRSGYFDYKRELDYQNDYGIAELEKAFFDQVEKLAHAQVPFHFLDETLLEKHGFVEGASIGCGLCKYDYLVLPTCYTLSKNTDQLLKQYVEAGGKILLLDEAPGYLEGQPHEFTYLNSNVTWEEILDAQAYHISNHNTDLISTYGECEEGAYLFVVNRSEEETYTVDFTADGYESFVALNLETMESEKMPMSGVTFRPYESKVLFLSKEQAEAKAIKETIVVGGAWDLVGEADNAFLIDHYMYSIDGGNTYSKELPYMGIFQALLEKRYKGTVHLKQVFDMKYIPANIRIECEKGSNEAVYINGEKVSMEDVNADWMQGDVTPFVQMGENVLVQEVEFFQQQHVYDVLFGGSEGESLKNCLTYDTTIEAVRLRGHFGVYEKNGLTEFEGRTDVIIGRSFVIDKPPVYVEELVSGGYPFFAGKLVLEKEITLENPDVLLELQAPIWNVKVSVNGTELGMLQFDNRLDISRAAVPGQNKILLEYTVSNRNLYGPHHMVMDPNPAGVSPMSFEMADWVDGESPRYTYQYHFITIRL